jgi:pilus assembly protein FimV
MTQIGKRSSESEDPTQEVAIEDLGLDVGDGASLDDADEFSATFEIRPGTAVEDTVENPRIPVQAREDQDEDILSSTGIFSEKTGILPVLDPTNEIPTLDATSQTGLMPTIKAAQLSDEISGQPSGEVDFDLGDEPFTLSEVGTKLDLARAYVDMGDPEGARSILDEVLKEGSAEQKQEAERLMATLPS